MDKKILSCDWGTSSLRIRLVDNDTGLPVDELLAHEGIASVYEAWTKAALPAEQRLFFYQQVLKRYLEKLPQDINGLPIILSGMASSSIGIEELPYNPIPFTTDGKNIAVKTFTARTGFPHTLHIISGACTGLDVMRGEETQLVGCANQAGSQRTLYIFPGTHSKHVVTASGMATALTTYMTGELFQLLSTRSVLAASVAPGVGGATDELAFAAGVRASAGQALSHAIFMVRTNQVLKKMDAAANYDYLSGLLIGAELYDMDIAATDVIILVGEKKLVASYRLALDIMGIHTPIQSVDATTATINGHLAFYRRLYAADNLLTL